VDVKSLLNVSASGMQAQRARTEAIASNLANANVTRTEDGTPYQRRVPVFEMSADSPMVQVTDIEQVKSYRKEYDPSHPHADDDGYVLRPDIDIMTEMVDLMESVRSYEANANVVDVTKELVSRALAIGK
jgi:flagellar basal-body rod protein FlgC